MGAHVLRQSNNRRESKKVGVNSKWNQMTRTKTQQWESYRVKGHCSLLIGSVEACLVPGKTKPKMPFLFLLLSRRENWKIGPSFLPCTFTTKEKERVVTRKRKRKRRHGTDQRLLRSTYKAMISVKEKQQGVPFGPSHPLSEMKNNTNFKPYSCFY
ncbi:hypothetical protein V6N13_115468 [Hibiscus sabdariffa]|uniref:Uncharacterized protein n=1 Tax=Hibiscus sabdariffa TaxID=183260 RepID=A0ABR2CRU1_9ROSI